MSCLAITERNPNSLQVEGLEVNASIISVDILRALYTLKRAGWVKTQHGWQEGTDKQKSEFWKLQIPSADETPGQVGEDHIMKRPRTSKMDSLLAEAQVYRTGRWERTAMGGWKRIVIEDEKENGSQQDNSENDDTLIDSLTDGPRLEVRYKSTKQADNVLKESSKHYHPYGNAIKPAQKRKKVTEPKNLRPQPNVNMEDYDVSLIHLDDEEEENIPIFDTCDDLREKVKLCLSSSGMTRAAFMRLICSAAFPTSKKSIQDRQLANFQGQSGSLKGCESNVCYAAYVYLEKLRIKNGEEKSQKREEMEEIWDDEGIPRKMQRGGYIVSRDNDVYVDEYGVVGVIRNGFIRDESIEEKAARNWEMRIRSF